MTAVVRPAVTRSGDSRRLVGPAVSVGRSVVVVCRSSVVVVGRRLDGGRPRHHAGSRQRLLLVDRAGLRVGGQRVLEMNLIMNF